MSLPEQEGEGNLPIQQSTTGGEGSAGTIVASLAKKPPNPTMGVYTESYHGSKEWTASSGGVPLRNWSGIDHSAPKSSSSPWKNRPLSQAARSKIYRYLINPLEPKFEEGLNINHFRKDVNKHLVTYGLDTIAYLPDPSNNNKVANVVIDYPLFVGNLINSLKLAKDTQAKYDEMDNFNSGAATEFLTKSLEEKLSRRLDLHVEPEDSFATTWLRLMKLITSVGPRHYDRLKERVRTCNPTKYEHENITLMAEDIGISIGELESANQYEPALTQSMLSSINNTCSDKGLFSFELMSVLKRVSSEVLVCNHMSKFDANEHMATKDLDPDTILKELQQVYNTTYLEGMWEPANRKIDRAKPQLSLIESADAGNGGLQKLIGLLENSGANRAKKVAGIRRDKSKVKCYNCDKLGHYANECPEKKKEGSRSSASRGNGRKGSESGKSRHAWRKIPPGSDGKQSKMVDRKEYHWCAKCRKWQTSHGTSTHRGSQRPQDDVTAAANLAANFNLGLEPSAWLVTDPTAFAVTPTEDTQLSHASFSSGSGLLACCYMALVWYFLPTYGASRTACLVGLASSMSKFFGALGIFTIARFDSLVSHSWSRIIPMFNATAEATIKGLFHLKTVPLPVFLAPLLWIFLFFLLTYAPACVWKSPPTPVRTRCRAGRVADMGVNRWSRAFRKCTPPRLRGRLTPQVATYSPARGKKHSLRDRLRTRHRQRTNLVPRPLHQSKRAGRHEFQKANRFPVRPQHPQHRRKHRKRCPVHNMHHVRSPKYRPDPEIQRKLHAWARKHATIGNMMPFRNPLLPRKPVLIRRDLNAPPVTKRRAKELDALIYGNRVPPHRPPYLPIRVKRDTVFAPVSTVCMPEYDESTASEVLHTMFGNLKATTVPIDPSFMMMTVGSKRTFDDFVGTAELAAEHEHSDTESDEELILPSRRVLIKQESGDESPVKVVEVRTDEYYHHYPVPCSQHDELSSTSSDVSMISQQPYWESSDDDASNCSDGGYEADWNEEEALWNRTYRAHWAIRDYRDEHEAEGDVTKLCDVESEDERIVDLYEQNIMQSYLPDVCYHHEPWNQLEPGARPPFIAMANRSVVSEDESVRGVFPSPPFHVSRCTRRSFRKAPPQQKSDDLFPIVWDSGASVCVTNDKSDFWSFTSDASIKEISGYANGSNEKVQGEGIVAWDIMDLRGNLRSIFMPAYYMPNSKVRLMSTQTFLARHPDETIQFDSDGATVSGDPNVPNYGPLFAPKNVASGLVVSMGSKTVTRKTINSISVYPKSSPLASVPAVARENINLTGAEKELLGWHERFGHIAFAKVQHLMKSGVLATSEVGRRLQRRAAQLRPLKCAACIFAKQRQRSTPGQVTKVNQARDGIIRKGNLLPGQEISVDYFACPLKGRLFTSRGKTADKNMYSGGCMFVDHASGYIHVECQTGTTTHDTIQAKTAFEDMCRDHGVVAQSYLSDNGSCFTSKAFGEHLSEFKQITRFAGVGAHHHNGHAERAIQTIMSIARAMMIHAAIRWPDMADSSLWPMAVQHAVWIWNHTPNLTTGLSPADIFTKKTYPHGKFQDLHVWGCPVYALEKRVHDGNKLPKWTPRSKRCVYLGGAPSYATSVPLVLNPETGHISPQFHVVFDDWFNTVTSDMSKFPDLHSDEWNKLFGDSALQYMPDLEDIELSESLQSQLEGAKDADHADKLRTKLMEAAENVRPTVPLGSPALDTPAWREKKPETKVTSNRTVRFETPALADPAAEPTRAPSPPTLKVPEPPVLAPKVTSDPPPAPIVTPLPPAAPAPAPTPKPSTRPVGRTQTQPPRRSRRVAGKEPIRRSSRLRKEEPQFTATINAVTPSKLPPFSHFAQTLLAFIAPTGAPVGDGSTFDIGGQALPQVSVSPGIFAAQKNKDPDILTYEEAMRDPDREKWLEAAGVEISELESYNSWMEVPRSEAEEANADIVPTTWVFRRKRRPDGTIKRWKARFCVRGDLMRGITDTFAPVVAFSTVRIFLIFSLILGWFTCSIDFSNAFIQAHRTKPIYMHLPRGFTAKRPGFILKLIRSLYGAKDAPKLWTKHLFKALRELNFKQSKFDPCLWYKDDIFIVIFVDDCGICSKTEAIADAFIKSMEEKGFKLTKEDSFAEFLGIQYENHSNGDVHLTQKGLIKKILEATGLMDANSNKVPAAKETLGIDPTGVPSVEPWSYPSIIGMLLYLTTNTRPDIAFAVSQVARFTHAPKQSHATAVKMIVRYLKGTMDYGTIVKKATKLSLTCFCDADFAGLFKRDPDKEQSSAKSRTGYIIKLSGCPLISKSQLQPTISLSTAESEYYALSQAMRVLLPIRSLVEELMQNVHIPPSLRTLGNHIRATVHEDNTSCLSLANDQRITSRTRHYHVRWHFFWHHVNQGNVEVVYVETNKQDADYLTKSLPVEPFLANRKRVQGW